MECCHKCGLKIYDAAHFILYVRGANHYQVIQEIYESSIFNSTKIELHLFFRQLWKEIISESESTFIKNFHSLESPIPVGLLYKEISKGLIKIYNNPKKLDQPFEERTFYNHLSQAINSNENIGEKHVLLLKTNPYVKKRLEILTSLLDLGFPSIKEIKELGKNVEFHWMTLYRWWRSYQEKGIEGLIPNFSSSGRKRGEKIKCYPKFNTLHQEKILNYVKGREKKSVKELF
ncbi:MAG: helix-turn-helix domain-containing protein [Promethearchaeota archaeon]